MSSLFPIDKVVVALDESNPTRVKAILERFGYSFSPSYPTSELEKDWARLKEKIIILSPSFNRDNVSAVILSFEGRNERTSEERISDYLLNKGIPVFTSITSETTTIENGALPYREDDDLKIKMMMAKAHHYTGVKAKSLIVSSDSKAVHEALKPLFSFARLALKMNLIPILEIEVDIRIPDKGKAEKKALKELLRHAKRNKGQIIYRLSYPEKDDFYAPLLLLDNTIGLLSLGGGLDQEAILRKIPLNPSLTPTFSRFILSRLNVRMSDEEFQEALSSSFQLLKKN